MDRIEACAADIARLVINTPNPTEAVIKRQAAGAIRGLLNDAEHWLATRSGAPDEVLRVWLADEVELSVSQELRHDITLALSTNSEFTAGTARKLLERCVRVLHEMDGE